MRIREHATPLESITDWYTLGAALHIRPHVLSWTLGHRESMQHRINLGKRIVYRSDTALRHVQTKIILLVEPLVNALPDNECILAYRKGVIATDKVRTYAGADVMMSFDIQKYYDHITLQHIENSLVRHGFSPTGARLIGRYCVVRTYRGSTLQQGSPSSPALSNLVGYHYLDVPLRKLLKEQYPNIDCKYVRYCDNVALFIRGTLPENFKEEFKNSVRALLRPAGFFTHKWETIASTHPKRNQKFLGVVLNAQARVEKEHIDNLRATLHNCCLHGLASEASWYLEKYGTNPMGRKTEFAVDESEIILKRFKPIIQGHINYVFKINEKHGLWLKKLYAAALRLEASGIPRDIPGLRELINSYKNEESQDAFMARLDAKIDSVNETEMPFSFGTI